MKKILLLLFIGVAIFCGCGIFVDPAATAKDFLHAIASRNFAKAYDLTWYYSPQRYSKEEFVAKYTSIFSGLQVSDITYSNEQLNDDGTQLTYTYDAVYHTKYGEFEGQYTMMLAITEEGYAVDYAPNLILPEMEFGDTIRVSTQNANRGEIFTQDHYVLAKNTYAYTVFLQVAEVENIDETSLGLSAYVDISAMDIVERYDYAKKNGYEVAIVKSFQQLDSALMEKITAIQGVAVDAQGMTPLRYYEENSAAAHLTGYATAAQKEDLEKLSMREGKPPAFVGRTGLEGEFNEELSEQRGILVALVDESGSVKRTLYEEQPKHGADVWLNIDGDLQERAYLALAQYVDETQGGCAVVLNADTGAVLCAASYPSFDPNKFTLGVAKDYWDSLMENKLTPLYSRFSQGRYPPGSTFKPFTIVPALDSGVITTNSVFPATERVVDRRWTPSFERNWYFPPITRKDPLTLEPTLENCMIVSDNIFFAYAMLKLGEDKLMDYLHKIGMDKPLDFALPLGKPNILNAEENLTRKMLADMGYGQGELLITPVQLAAMFTAFVNDGDILTPQLVNKISISRDGKEEILQEFGREVAVADVISASARKTLLPILKKVMEPGGTGSPSRVSGKTLAGKTGTAQLGGEQEIGWIVTFETEGQDRRLVLVMVDGPARLGATKFAIAKELMSYQNLPETPPDTTPNED